jgi:flagellar hook-associated protein 1 FlgK
MSGLNVALETAKRALFSQQTAVNVTGHNIANVNTPGYSRQRADLVSGQSLKVPGGRVGTGVEVNTIERIYDRFLSGQISTQVQNKGKAAAEQQVLDQVQAVFNETGGIGLNDALSEFWNAWQSLATNPTGAAERSGVISATTTLAQRFRDTDNRLDTLQTDINHLVSGDVDRVNLLTKKIAGMNVAIQQTEIGGQQPANDLRDQQQILLDELAELVPVQIFQQGDGQLGVQLPGGKPLVNGTAVWELTTSPAAGGITKVQWRDQSGAPTDITNQLSQGKLGGLIRARDTLLVGYRQQLDTLAAGLIEAVNGIHTGGVDLNGADGLELFKGTSAGDIVINPLIQQDPNKLAAAKRESDGTYAAGDNRNALAIAALQTTPPTGSTRTLDESYGQLISQIGTDAQRAEQDVAYQGAILEQLNNRRDAISGVSIDEEMTNLIKFQQAYSAAARLITRVDDMMRMVIEMV